MEDSTNDAFLVWHLSFQIVKVLVNLGWITATSQFYRFCPLLAHHLMTNDFSNFPGQVQKRTFPYTSPLPTTPKYLKTPSPSLHQPPNSSLNLYFNFCNYFYLSCFSMVSLSHHWNLHGCDCTTFVIYFLEGDLRAYFGDQSCSMGECCRRQLILDVQPEAFLKTLKGHLLFQKFSVPIS